VIDFTLSQLMMRIAAVILLSALQGFATAAAAVALGDAGPRHDGRLSIDPLRHIDLLGGAVALIFAVGWSRWVAVDPRALRPGCQGLALVGLASFIALIASVVILRLVRPYLLLLLSDTAAAATFQVIQTYIEMGISFALLGLLPLPPLSGGHFLIAVLPQLRERLAQAQLFLGVGVAVLVATGIVGLVLDPAARALMILILGEDVGL